MMSHPIGSAPLINAYFRSVCTTYFNNKCKCNPKLHHRDTTLIGPTVQSEKIMSSIKKI